MSWFAFFFFFFPVKLVCESHHSALSHTAEPTLDLNVSHYIFCETDSKKTFFFLAGEGGFNVTHKDIKRIFYSIVLFKPGSLGCECTLILDQRDAGDFSRSLSPPITPAAAAAAVQLLSPPSASGSVSSNQLLSLTRFYFPSICHAALFF